MPSYWTYSILVVQDEANDDDSRFHVRGTTSVNDIRCEVSQCTNDSIFQCHQSLIEILYDKQKKNLTNYFPFNETSTIIKCYWKYGKIWVIFSGGGWDDPYVDQIACRSSPCIKWPVPFILRPLRSANRPIRCRPLTHQTTDLSHKPVSEWSVID